MHVRIVGKFLWWFVKELIATPAAIREDIRRIRARREEREGLVQPAGATPEPAAQLDSAAPVTSSLHFCPHCGTCVAD